MPTETARLSGDRLCFRCPGCQDVHSLNVGSEAGPRWSWNGSVVSPTLSPSLLIRSGHFASHWQAGDNCWCTYNAQNPEHPAPFACAVCHSFVRDGQIEFLSDCTHALAGKTVPLPAWENS